MVLDFPSRVIVGTLCRKNHAGIRLREKIGYPRCAHIKNIGEKPENCRMS
jgi:hypothetical protein